MPECVFYTYAYNARETLERTVRSVLSQTHRAFTYYLVDNGSTDGTGGLIDELARADSRIVPLANRQNHVWDEGTGWWSIVQHLAPDDVFCFLDADDTYRPEFLEHTLRFMQENRLDIAACGNDFIDVPSQSVYNVRKLPANLVIERRGFSRFFPKYHQFMRTMWAKLYRAFLLQQFDFSRTPSLRYGGDTLFVIENFRRAGRVGVLAQSLHQYYVSPGAVSFQFDPQRIESSHILYEAMEQFLLEKCGQMTARNADFLLMVFFHDMKDALSVVLGAEAPDTQKLDLLLKQFDCTPARRILTCRDLGEHNGMGRFIQGERKQFLEELVTWMLSREEVADEQMERFCNLGELLCAAMERSGEWALFRNLWTQFQLEQGQKA